MYRRCRREYRRNGWEGSSVFRAASAREARKGRGRTVLILVLCLRDPSNQTTPQEMLNLLTSTPIPIAPRGSGFRRISFPNHAYPSSRWMQLRERWAAPGGSRRKSSARKPRGHSHDTTHRRARSSGMYHEFRVESRKESTSPTQLLLISLPSTYPNKRIMQMHRTAIFRVRLPWYVALRHLIFKRKNVVHPRRTHLGE